MKVFVTGASGGFGVALRGLLRSQGTSVLGLSREVRDSEEGIDWLRADLLDPESYESQLAGCEMVIHMAAMTHSHNPDDYMRVNVEGTRCLLGACQRAAIERFLYVSTRAIGPVCGAYGASKLKAEELVRGSGLKWTIVRPGEVYGAKLNEAVTGVLRSVETKRWVLLPGLGRAKIAPVHLHDVLTAMLEALRCLEAEGRVYTLCGPEEMSYRELVCRLCEIRGVKPWLVPVPIFVIRLAAWLFGFLRIRRAPLVADQVPRLLGVKSADISAARRDLGFAPVRIEEGLVGGVRS